jgi:hypothetical protein
LGIANLLGFTLGFNVKLGVLPDRFFWESGAVLSIDVALMSLEDA